MKLFIAGILVSLALVVTFTAAVVTGEWRLLIISAICFYLVIQ
jgi:hypothetical protein